MVIREGDFVTRWHLSKDKTFKRCGMLGFEAHYLTQTRMTHASIRHLLADRRQFYKEKQAQKVTRQDYEALILAEYERQNWRFKDGNLNPYAMLDFYKRQADIPDTPQPKRNVRGKRQAYSQLRGKSRRDMPVYKPKHQFGSGKTKIL